MEKEEEMSTPKGLQTVTKKWPTVRTANSGKPDKDCLCVLYVRSANLGNVYPGDIPKS